MSEGVCVEAGVSKEDFDGCMIPMIFYCICIRGSLNLR